MDGSTAVPGLEVRTIVRINARNREGKMAPLYIDPESGDVFRRLSHFRFLAFDPEYGDHLDNLKKELEERDLQLLEGEGAGPPLGVFLDDYESWTDPINHDDETEHGENNE